MYGNTTNAGSMERMSNEAMSNSISSKHQETMTQLSRTVSQAEDLLRALGDESGEAIDAMRTRVSATLRDARTRLAGSAEQAQNIASNTMSQADRYVHENPWRAVAIGAGHRCGGGDADVVTSALGRRRLVLLPDGATLHCRPDAHCCGTLWSMLQTRAEAAGLVLQSAAIRAGAWSGMVRDRGHRRRWRSCSRCCC